MPLKHSLLSTVYLYGSGWMWSRTHSLCLTSIRAASQMPVCLWWRKPSWIPARRQSTAWAKTPPLTSCCMPRTFPATRAGWRGEQEHFYDYKWLNRQTQRLSITVPGGPPQPDKPISEKLVSASCALHGSKVLVWRNWVETARLF